MASVAGGSHRFGRAADAGGLAVFWLFLVWLVAASISGAHWNWDLVPYVALALESRFSDPAVLHAETFEEIRRVVAPARFAALTTGAYFGDIFRDPEALQKQLPFYRVKPAYVALLRILASAGLSPVTATLMVSIAGCVSVAMIVLLWLRRYFAAKAAGPLTVILLLLIGLPTVARISSPDALSGFTLLVALYALCEHGALRAASLAILLSVAIRSDNVINGLSLAALLVALDRGGDWHRSARHAVTALGVVLVYEWNVRSAGAYPWETFFLHSFAIDPVSRPAEWHETLSLGFYLEVLARNYRMFLNPQPVAIALLGVVAFAQLPVAAELEPRLRRALPPTVLGLALFRYLLYPYVMGRHLLPFYAAIGVLFLTSNAGLGSRFGLPAKQTDARSRESR
jgi:hypothetical protein